MNPYIANTENFPGAIAKKTFSEPIRRRKSLRFLEKAGAKLFSFVWVLILSATFISFSHCRGAAQDPILSREFLDGVAHYQKNEYKEAADAFERVADSGIANGKLFYNLGNAYLKTGDLGKAILWYERALRLIPDDPDLKFNLDYARSLVKDARDEKKSTMVKVLFFWRQALSPSTVKQIAVYSNVAFWMLLALKKIQTFAWRRASALKVLRYLSFFSALVFTLTALYGYYLDKHCKTAVIISERAPIRSGLTENSTQLFVLHAGTKITIEKEAKDHYRIYFSEDKIGWLKKSEAAII